MKGILTFNDQEETCSNCLETNKVDCVLDRETGRYYFICPDCGQGNVEP